MNHEGTQPVGEGESLASDRVFARQVRDVLTHLHNPTYLQTHPLTRRVPLPDPGPSRLSPSRALWRDLIESIDALRPAHGVATESRAGRHHRILSMRFVDGLDAMEVARRLSIGKSEYYREQQRAIDAVASLLLERWTARAGSASVGSTSRGTERVARGYQSRALGRRTESLPSPTASFVGRERELADLDRLLASARLVTLYGPPGTGKTRLALESARRARARFPDDVHFVPLAALGDPSLLASTVAHALGLRDDGEAPALEGLRAALLGREALLVLDNFEHLIEAGGVVAELLARCPGLKVLVTSRVVLGLYGEHTFPVPPLSLPSLEWQGSGAHPGQFEAVELFVERARAVDPTFDLLPENAEVVVDVCRQLDGLPLAIELAVARLRLLPLPALLARLNRRLELLTSGVRDLPRRHQALRGAIAWSYELLQPEIRALFRRLAVFAGGFSFEAAYVVCDLESSGAESTLKNLSTLLESSLLLRHGSRDEPRFWMLETIREYGLEELAAADEADVVGRRHLEHFVALAERAEPELVGARQAAQLGALEHEVDNFRAALDWSATHDERDLGLRLGAALWRFWWVRGYLSEGREWLDRLLATAPARTVAKARALRGSGALAFYQGDFAAARTQYEESLAICREVGDRAGEAWSLLYLGWISADKGDQRWSSLLSASVEAASQTGDELALAMAGNIKGYMAIMQGEPAVASPFLGEALRLSRRVGDSWTIAWSLRHLGMLRWQENDLTGAHSLLDESLAISREIEDQRNVAGTLFFLGHVAFEESKYDEARPVLLESLRILARLREKWMAGLALTSLGGVVAAEGRPDLGLRLAGAAEALADKLGIQMPVWWARRHASWVESAGRAIGLERAEEALAGGRTLPIEAAIAEGLAVR